MQLAFNLNPGFSELAPLQHGGCSTAQEAWDVEEWEDWTGSDTDEEEEGEEGKEEKEVDTFYAGEGAEEEEKEEEAGGGGGSGGGGDAIAPDGSTGPTKKSWNARLADLSDEPCGVCGDTAEGAPEKGEIVVCDGAACMVCTHTGCMDPPLSRAAEGDWFCSMCRPL